MCARAMIKEQICYSCRNKVICQWYQAHKGIRPPIHVDDDGVAQCEFYERAFYDVMPRYVKPYLAKSHRKIKEFCL